MAHTIAYDATAKTTAGSKPPAGIEFFTWNGSIQYPQKSIEYFTRLGSNQLIITDLKTESPISPIEATIVSTAGEKSDYQSILDTCKLIGENIGTRFTYTDNLGIIRTNCYMITFKYNIKAVSGAKKLIATCNFDVMTDVN